MILYKTTNLSYEIDSRTIFSNLDFEISSNAIYEIRGKNGSGKSSLLKILSGLNKMEKVYYDEDLESNITYLGHKNGFVEEISLRNNFEIIEDGDHVVCAISQKKIALENLTYWNVKEQEPYFSYIEASIKRDTLTKK